MKTYTDMTAAPLANDASIDDYITPVIEWFFNEKGQTMAVCVAGLTGNARPDDNKSAF